MHACHVYIVHNMLLQVILCRCCNFIPWYDNNNIIKSENFSFIISFNYFVNLIANHENHNTRHHQRTDIFQEKVENVSSNKTFACHTH